MTDPTLEKPTTWLQSVFVHMRLVVISFLLSIVILPAVTPFDPEGTGGAVLVVIIPLTHGIATVVAVFFRKVTKVSSLLVFGVGFFFTGLALVFAIRNSLYLKYQAPYDRFRDYLTSPVPASVADLHFVGLDEKIKPDLMLEFDIAPADLDAILSKLKMERLDADKLRDPKDYFRYPFYIPIAGKYELFQGTDKYDEVLTFKTDQSHSHAVFRKESSNYYKDRMWEGGNPLIDRMNEEDLKRLRKKASR